MRIIILAAAAVLAASASAAAAVTVIGATSIVVTNAPGGAYLQVAEVVATTFGTGINAALAANGGSASANDQYQAGPESNAANAIDGNTGGAYYSDYIYHGLNPSGSVLTIGLAAPTTLSSLTLYGRTDCCQSRDVFNVSIFGGATLLYAGTFDARSGAATTSFDAPSTVPEPATWGLLIAGFAMTGLSLRRRTALAA